MPSATGGFSYSKGCILQTIKRGPVKLVCLLLLFLPFSIGQAAQTASTPTAPLSSTATPPVTPAEITAMENKLQDWPDLARYRAENATLAAPAPGENRVVFMGDSITEFWSYRAKFFPGKPYINRGISGQTTPQILVRFRPDVIALQPKVVVILAGINDIAGNTGPSTPEMIEDNLSSMAELARLHHIHVVLASILPAAAFPWKPGIDPREEVRTVNHWIQDYCSSQGFTYLDYYSSMADPDSGMKKSLTLDGVHPNEAGYQIMAPLAEKAIAQALNQK